ncbi:MAG: MBL fold metallo-hydrolase [Phycisphaerae bacterium]|nr:MBL fold metallo-hydrolase [Phycisphaerae bacterium]
MLTLTFLGVGNAFAKRNFQSNVLLEAWSGSSRQQGEPEDTLLIDFGATGPQALHRLKDQPGFEYLDHGGVVDYRKIRNIFVTHLHSDHIGGLEELAFMNTFIHAQAGVGHRPLLISSSEILTDLWEHSLQGGLGVLHGRQAELADYFVVHPLEAGLTAPGRFVWSGGYELQPFRTDHVRLARKYDWPSLGLLIRDCVLGESVFFSGDTGFDFEAYRGMMTASRLCFHEVHLGNEDLSVHTSLKDLRTLPAEIRGKTFLYHYSDAWDLGRYEVVDREFAGFARPFHRYVLFD